MAAKTKTEKIRGEFEGKYGAPKDPSKRVLIGMKSGKAVYGDDWDEVTPMENEITNTYSQNQEELGRVLAEMKRSGGMYNPSPNDITRMENKYPTDAKDTQNEIKRDGASPMIGSDSPAAVSMRENPAQNVVNNQVLQNIRNKVAQQQEANRRTEPSRIAQPPIQRGAYNRTRPAAAPAGTPAAAPAVTRPAAAPAGTPAAAPAGTPAAAPAGTPAAAKYPVQQFTPSATVVTRANDVLDDYGFDVLTGQILPQYTSPFPRKPKK
jgi:hypothetical protein